MKPNRKSKDTSKPKHFKKTWARLIQYSRKYRIFMIIAFVAVIGATILQLLTPDLVSKLTDAMQVVFVPTIENGEVIFGRIDFTEFYSIVTTILIFYAISLVLNLVQNFIMSTATQKIAKDLRSDLSTKISKLPLKYFDSTSYGDTLSRVTNDVDMVGQSLNQSLATFVGSIVMFVGSMIMMFSTNWILAFTAIGASILGFVLVAVIMANSQKFFTAQQAGLGDLNGYVEEIYTNHNVVKSYNGINDAKKEFGVYNKSLYTSAWKSQFFSGMMMPLMGFIGKLGYVFVSVVGAVLVSRGTIGYGVIMAFIIYVNLFSNSLSQLGQAVGNFQTTAAAGERVFDFIDETELEDESSKTLLIENAKGDVEFKNVKFGYDPDRVIINDFSAKVKAGQKVAIVGPTGAGKTTMVNLLMRFYEIDSGSILIDNIDTSLVTRENVHDQFCMVLQDTWIFGGTIYENIIFSEENITKEQVREASKKLGLDHFIRTMPYGYDTILDDKTSLSEGQKQIITIARAMIKNSPLLILDEATSSVDTRTELIIQAAMDELMKGRTSFVIAHRLSTIRNSDLILVMKDGDIVESGNHEVLLAKNGFYSTLYNSQFEE